MTSPRFSKNVGLAIVAAEAALLGSACLWYFAPLATEIVRPLAVHATSPKFFSAPGVEVFHSQDELRAAYPLATWEPAGELDFGRDDLVRVVWESAGILSDADGRDSASDPPSPEFGRLRYRTRQGGGTVQFYVDEPLKWGRVKRVFSKLHDEQWFRVPKHTHVELGGSWNTLPLDGVVSIGLAAMLGIMAFGVRIPRWRQKPSRRERTTCQPTA